MENLLVKILCSSIKNLFDTQPDIFKFTSQSGETEWNLGHHLANEIQKYIFWLNCDIELTKRNYGNKRPDIVFHKRNTNSLNFLVVELKHRGASNKKDIDKIRNYWMANGLHYRFGASIRIIRKDCYTITVLTRKKKYFCDCKNIEYIGIPSISTSLKNNIINLADQILSITSKETYDPKSDSEDNRTAKRLEQQIDQLVYKLYNLTPEEIKIIEKS